MGTGIIGYFKSFAPFPIYILWIVMILVALSGRIKWPLLFFIVLQPLQNIVDKIQDLPFGNQLNDILLVGMIIGWFVQSSSSKEKIMERSPVNGMLFLLISYTYLSLWRGYFYLNDFNPFNIADPRLQDWKNYCILPVIFFLVFNNIKDKKWINRTIMVMALTMAAMDYYTIGQISDFSGLVSRAKIHSTFQWLGPNEVAAFYNQYTVLLISLYFGLKRGVSKIFLLLLIVTNVYCIIFLFSRAAYIGLVIGLFLLFTAKKKLLLIPLFVIILFWQVLLPEQVKERILTTKNEEGQLEESAESRLMIWQQSVDLFKSSPVFGVGFRVFRNLGFALGDTHNIYLKILAEQGVFGLFVFLLLIVILFIRGIRLSMHGDDEFSKSLGLGFAMCIIVLLVNNFFGDRWSYLQVSAFLWVFAGLVERLNFISDLKINATIVAQKTVSLRSGLSSRKARSSRNHAR